MGKQQTAPIAQKCALPSVSLQRKCACGNHTMAGGECAECRKEKLALRRRASSHEELNDAPPIVDEVLGSPGHPLDSGTRAFMESRFGHDFSHVRLHTDTRAAESAQAVNAIAYTVGRHVILGAGQHAPHSESGNRLLAHELTHVLQQQGQSSSPTSTLKIGAPDDAFERQADAVAESVLLSQPVAAPSRQSGPVIQRDLARPPQGPPAARVQLTQAQIQAAITFNQNRFTDPYSIRVIRDVLGLAPLPALVDEPMIQAVAAWQAERNLTQNGQVEHLTTRSLYLELVAEAQFRDAILLLMDSYQLPGDLRLHDIRVGTGANCCGPGGAADAVTVGGPHCGGGPIDICFCRPLIPQTTAQYDHFVRIAGHELLHVPQCAAGTGNVDVDEFEAFFFEACSQGRAPQLSAAERINHANIALAHFAAIPAALRTPARVAMRNQLNNLLAANGVGPC